jgi:C4-dicarboxylate transporter, DctQ subunit
MREALRQAAAALMTALRIAAGLMLVASVGINFANIIGRYFLSVSLSWAEEAMLFLMIGCVFLAAGPVGWMGRHIRMDVVISLLPPKARAAFEIFSDLVTIATCIALAIFAWPVMTMLTELDQRSASANIPMVIPQAAVPAGLLLMAVLIAVRLYVRGVRHDGIISSRDPNAEPRAEIGH